MPDDHILDIIKRRITYHKELSENYLESSRIDSNRALNWQNAACALFVAASSTLPFFNSPAGYFVEVVPAFATSVSLMYRRSAKQYRLQASVEHRNAENERDAFDRERTSILRSVRNGENSRLTELFNCLYKGHITLPERDSALEDHVWKKNHEALRNLDYTDALLYDLICREQSAEGSTELPDDGYDGWISEDDLPD